MFLANVPWHMAFQGAAGDANLCPHTKKATVASAELKRAQLGRAMKSEFVGKTHADIATKLNRKIGEDHAAACESFEPSDLDALFRKLWCHKSDVLNGMYDTKDGRSLLHDSLAGYEARWETEYAAGHDADALRDGKCAHVLMTWVHHLAEDSKAELSKQGVKMPTLPAYDVKKHAVSASAFTCVSGHNQTEGHVSDHVWPHWPAEVHYTGMGHGAYPFWMGGQGGCTTASCWWPGAPIEVWWSETKSAEKFYHTACATTELGYSSDVPCYHLFTGTMPAPAAYMYTEKEDFCCKSNPSPLGANGDKLKGPSGKAEPLTQPQSDFMDAMTLSKNFGSISGTYYSGTVDKYSMKLASTEAVDNFWYVTTPEGLPVQQGEGGGGTICELGKNCATSGGSGIYLFHEYNTSSFKAVTLDDSVFKVPDICLTTTKTCEFP